MMHKFVYALFIGLATILFGVTLTAPVTTHAAEIQVAGLKLPMPLSRMKMGRSSRIVHRLISTKITRLIIIGRFLTASKSRGTPPL